MNLKKTVLLLYFSVAFLHADVSWNDALFAEVINLKKDDALNVREKPNYRSKKVSKLPMKAYVGVDKCKELNSSTWCHVYPLVQRWYEDFSSKKESGWVNAKYLSFSDRGYVLVDGKADCAYVLQCQNAKCELLLSSESNNKPQTKWIEKNRVHGESRFGAASEDPKINPEGGYCSKARL